MDDLLSRPVFATVIYRDRRYRWLAIPNIPGRPVPMVTRDGRRALLAFRNGQGSFWADLEQIVIIRVYRTTLTVGQLANYRGFGQPVRQQRTDEIPEPIEEPTEEISPAQQETVEVCKKCGSPDCATSPEACPSCGCASCDDILCGSPGGQP